MSSKYYNLISDLLDRLDQEYFYRLLDQKMHWNYKERKRYLFYLILHNQQTNDFQHMAKYIGTKCNKKCKSFHQNVQKQNKTIKNFIEEYYVQRYIPQINLVTQVKAFLRQLYTLKNITQKEYLQKILSLQKFLNQYDFTSFQIVENSEKEYNNFQIEKYFSSKLSIIQHKINVKRRQVETL